ncbi:MAG TPA: tetratricopeptide repeat protein [Chitinophagales bacterium]|nr:tetratricopeptide repeat protein [Chitinophagales bacterium]
MNSLKSHSILVLLALLAAACGTSRETTVAGAPQQKEIPGLNIDNQLAQEAFIDGIKAKLLEDYEEAIRHFEKSIRLEPLNHAAMYELAQIFFRQGNFDQALKHIKTAVQLNGTNKWYALLYAEVLSYKGEYAAAASVYEKLLKQNPNDFDLYFDWAFMLIKAEKPEEAIKVYDQLESKIGIDENVIAQKQRLYVRLGKLDKAVAEVRKLISSNPREAAYYKMLADLYEANNMKDKAAKVYEELLEIDRENPHALIYLAEIYRMKGDKAASFDYLKKAFANASLPVDSKIRILLPYLQQLISGQQDQKEEAFTLAQLLIETHPAEPKTHAIFGDLLYQDKQLEEALGQYQQALELDSSVFEVWQQLFFIQSELKRHQELEKTTQSALELFPNQPLVYFFNGVAKNALKKYNEAVEILKLGEPLVVDNPPLKAQILSSLGEAYHDLKQYAASDSAFERALLFDPDNAYTMNNYSYYLSLRNENLERALELSEKSNRLVPDNDAFQDTYAWILYKMGRFSQAREWIEKSLENGGDQNPVILEHYGDILFKLGEVDKAVAYWEKAKSLGSESELIGKKIADRKIYE